MDRSKVVADAGDQVYSSRYAYATRRSATFDIAVLDIDVNPDLKIGPDKNGNMTDSPITTRYGETATLTWTSDVPPPGEGAGPTCWLITTTKDGDHWDTLNGAPGTPNNPNDGERDVVIRTDHSFRFWCQTPNDTYVEDTAQSSVFIPPGYISLGARPDAPDGDGNRELPTGAGLLEVEQGSDIELIYEIQDAGSCQASWTADAGLEGIDLSGIPVTGSLSLENLQSSRRFNIWCKDILGNTISDSATVSVRNSATVNIGVVDPSARALSFDINLCPASGTGCTDYNNATLTLKKKVGDGYFPQDVFSVGETVDLTTLNILDTDIIAFQANPAVPEPGVSFRDICLPSSQGCIDADDSDQQIDDITAICLFDPSADPSCVPVEVSLDNDNFVERVFAWLTGTIADTAEAVITAPLPTVTASYQTATTGCFIDVLTIEQAGIIIPPDPDTSFESETGEGSNFARRVLDWLNPAKGEQLFAQILPSVLVVDPDQELFLTWRSSNDLDSTLKGSGTLMTSSDFPDEVIGDEGTYAGPYHAPTQNGTYSYTLECRGTDDIPRTQTASVKVVSGFSLSAEPDEITVEGLTGPADQCVILTVDADSGFSGTVSFDATSDLEDKLKIEFKPAPSITLAQGGSGTTEMCVTLLSRAPRGIYGLDVTAQSGDGAFDDSVIVDLELQNIAGEEVVEF